ncbi:MAG: tetratricopeptide repeat protein [Gammaproteobacteria bacterium]|nr:tetratricopeptide repeat protein [Gammaproteobacteria bacterium]
MQRSDHATRSPTLRPRLIGPWVAVLFTLTWLVMAPLLAALQDTTDADTPAGLADEAEATDAPDADHQAAQPMSPGSVELELAFARAEADENFALAAELGTQWIDALDAELGPEHVSRVDAMTRLGTAQRQADLLDEAETSLLGAIDLAQQLEGRFSERQLGAIFELGRVYADMEEHMLAVATFTEAQALSRRLLGLLNLKQLDMLEAMSVSLRALEAWEEADMRALEAFQIAERNYGPDAPELLPAMYRLALWYRYSGRVEEERALYVRAIRLLEADGGSDDPRIIEPLRGLAKSMQFAASFIDPRATRNAPMGYPSAEQALNRALAIARAQEPPAPQLEALLLLDLGDWSMAMTRRSSAVTRYTEAWERLADAENGEELRARWFSRPSPVTSPQPSWLGVRQRGAEPGLEDGRVEASYTVNDQGRAEDILIIDSHPPGLKDTTVRRTLRSHRFRPRFEDGVPVSTPNQTYVFEFGFRP